MAGSEAAVERRDVERWLSVLRLLGAVALLVFVQPPGGPLALLGGSAVGLWTGWALLVAVAAVLARGWPGWAALLAGLGDLAVTGYVAGQLQRQGLDTLPLLVAVAAATGLRRLPWAATALLAFGAAAMGAGAGYVAGLPSQELVSVQSLLLAILVLAVRPLSGHTPVEGSRPARHAALAVEQMAALVDLARHVGQDLPRDDFAAAVLDRACQRTRSQMAGLILLQEESDAVLYTFADGRLTSEALNLDAETGQAPYERLFREERPLRLGGKDGALDVPGLPAQYPRRLESFLGTSLRGPEGVAGVLFVVNKSGADAYDEGDAVFIELLGALAGAVVATRSVVDRARQGMMETVGALVRAVEAKHPWTRGHAEQSMRLAVAIAREMGFAGGALEEVRVGAMLHDIGKLGIPDHILNKPGPLTAEELAIVREHCRYGARIIDSFNRSKTVLAMVYLHHERWDGRGYPTGRKGSDIPLPARIMALADAVEAMVAVRPHRPGRTPRQAIDEVVRSAGTQFDPEVVEAFLRVVGREGDNFLLPPAGVGGEPLAAGQWVPRGID